MLNLNYEIFINSYLQRKKLQRLTKTKNGKTIQQTLENAIKTLTKQEVNCVASGRTDAGVSAYCQPVHFEIESELNEDKFLYSLNGILPKDIKVLSIQKTDIHARFSAKKKTYLYKMYISNIELPLLNDALQINPNLNFKDMKKFLKLIKGTHDFIRFRASGGTNESTIRTIYSAKLKKQGNYLYFTITGNGFLYKMVRNIVGTMLKIGEGKINLQNLKQTLFKTFKSTHTAKPEHLYLLNVEYKK